jgi:hypothetical protein
MKRTTITIETTSLLILRSKGSTKAWCPLCLARVEMFLFENVAQLTDRASVLGQWLDSGEVHRVESIDGSSLLCLDSLLARAQKTNPATRGLLRLPNTQTKKERI